MYSNLKANTAKTDAARVIPEIIVAIIVGIVTCVVAIVVGIWTYNSRYDASATASGGAQYSFSSNHNSDSCTFTASAGSVYYGYFQVSGSSNTKYDLFYKKNNKPSYSSVKSVECSCNNDYTGDYYLTYNSNTQAYDFKVDRKNKKSTNSTFEMDWGIS